jgi:hypothetical protein
MIIAVKCFSVGLRLLVLAGFFGAGLISVSAAKADTTAVFHQALSDAYGHYREAFFYLRRGNAMTAAFELESMAQKWQALETRYATQPPPIYASDAKWAATLTEVGGLTRKALALASEGEAAPAYDLLKPLRSILEELRSRNGVTLFRDHVEGANQAFRQLFHFRRNPPDFADPKSVDKLRQRLTATIKAYQNALDKAPPSVVGDEQFARLIKDSLYYLDRMWVAIDEKNQLNVINILRRVVSSDEILWLRFG